MRKMKTMNYAIVCAYPFFIYIHIYSWICIYTIVHCAILLFVTGQFVYIIAGSLSVMVLLLALLLGVYCAKTNKTSKGTNPLCGILKNVGYSSLYYRTNVAVEHCGTERRPEFRRSFWKAILLHGHFWSDSISNRNRSIPTMRSECRPTVYMAFTKVVSERSSSIKKEDNTATSASRPYLPPPPPKTVDLRIRMRVRSQDCWERVLMCKG